MHGTVNPLARISYRARIDTGTVSSCLLVNAGIPITGEGPCFGRKRGPVSGGIGAVSSCLLVTVVAGNGCGGSMFRAEVRTLGRVRVRVRVPGECECGYRVGTG